MSGSALPRVIVAGTGTLKLMTSIVGEASPAGQFPCVVFEFAAVTASRSVQPVLTPSAVELTVIGGAPAAAGTASNASATTTPPTRVLPPRDILRNRAKW